MGASGCARSRASRRLAASLAGECRWSEISMTCSRSASRWAGGIFESRDLDFSRHRADGDDILGDAYEYLMRHFATESGKSKGQFYTPAEVSRVMAQVLGIAKAKTSPDTTVYDPTCGSGSLLLKVAEAAPTPVTIYGQEKEEVTSGLARMNMILHHNPGAVIEQGNTLADPKFLEGDQLKTFDYVVANPPFSDKRWSNGLVGDVYRRFEGFGTPPNKQGDYAYLLHIIRSLRPVGRAACILPHGVLFRGNAEAETMYVSCTTCCRRWTSRVTAERAGSPASIATTYTKSSFKFLWIAPSKRGLLSPSSTPTS